MTNILNKIKNAEPLSDDECIQLADYMNSLTRHSKVLSMWTEISKSVHNVHKMHPLVGQIVVDAALSDDRKATFDARYPPGVYGS